MKYLIFCDNLIEIFSFPFLRWKKVQTRSRLLVKVAMGACKSPLFFGRLSALVGINDMYYQEKAILLKK